MFIQGTAANALVVEFASGREIVQGAPRCVIKCPETRIGGHLGTCVGVTMIGIRTTEPCPLARVIDLMTAFRKVNNEWLLALQAKCRREVSSLGVARRGKNGKRFLSCPLAVWSFPASELTITEACNSSSSSSSSYLVEEDHMDGGMSLFHAGLTLGGADDLFCDVPAHGRASFLNSLGTFYFGNLTGPRRQVYHRHCEEHDLPVAPGLGRRSVTVMMRTGLFPNNHSRVNDQIPKPPPLWVCLKNVMVEFMPGPSIRLPPLEEVMQETRDKTGLRPQLPWSSLQTLHRSRRENIRSIARRSDV